MALIGNIAARSTAALRLGFAENESLRLLQKPSGLGQSTGALPGDRLPQFVEPLQCLLFQAELIMCHRQKSQVGRH